MARQTNTRLREKVIYSVFVRNHTKEGTFQALEGDLDRLAALGTDIIWLMPIHPIGGGTARGRWRPHAIRDFRASIRSTARWGLHASGGEIHKRGMKCIIDVVYNHTSPDSILATGHPEFFLRDEAGNPTRKVADWSDVVDLDYSNRELWKYQIETLKIWAEIVDGFRCDVASAVPLAFWREAREQVERVRPAASGWPRASMPPTRWPCAGRATTAPPTRSCMMPLISPTTTISGPISRVASSPPALSGSIRRW
ncbi:MAG: alpha-amylase family glycosyl hydrolase [Oscillospiraceae bacterium]